MWHSRIVSRPRACAIRRFGRLISGETATHRDDVTQLSSWIAAAVWTEFATSSRRLPADSVDVLKQTKQDCIAVWLREFLSITFSTMTSLCRNRSRQHRKLYTGSRLPTGAFTSPTRLNSIVESRRRQRWTVGFIFHRCQSSLFSCSVLLSMFSGGSK